MSCFSRKSEYTYKLSDDDRTSCEGKLTLNECWEALKSMGSNKSPGNGGLTKEFDVCRFNDVGQYLINALNLSFGYMVCFLLLSVKQGLP